VAQIIVYVALIVVGYLVIFAILNKRITRLMDPQAVLSKIREEVDRIIVELNSTTDRNITLMEDKVNSITDLLGKADKKIAVLRREVEKHEAAVKLYSELAQSHARGTTAQGEQEEDIHTQVAALHEQGISASVIAKRLGITLAEIELILSLAKKER
jgi:uncharacterized protein YoxC